MSSASPLPRDPWQWPVEITSYDRELQLRPVELAEIGAFMYRRETGFKRAPWFTRMQQALPRLINPLCDALQVVNANGQHRNAVVYLMLRKMYHDRVSYWATTEDEWRVFFKSDWKRYTSGPANTPYCYPVSVMYLLGGLRSLHTMTPFQAGSLAAQLFGQTCFDAALKRVSEALYQLGYSDYCVEGPYLPLMLGHVLLANHSPELANITVELLEALYGDVASRNHRSALSRLSYALFSLKLTERPIAPPRQVEAERSRVLAGVAKEWAGWCQRWRGTSTVSPETRKAWYRLLLQVGRWLAQEHPEVTSPEQWTRELAAEYVAVVTRMRVGDWTHQCTSKHVGRSLKAASQVKRLQVIRTFFGDCQEWGWIRRRFDPFRCFSTPRSILALSNPNPRVIADGVWAKILWAGLNLTVGDLPTGRGRKGVGRAYPVEMVRAVALAWLFGGLRVNEVRRLRLGCVRWQQSVDMASTEDAVCLLSVPVNKTGAAFTKPVDPVVGRAIDAWEAVRSASPPFLDSKTNEKAHYLFADRSVALGRMYINERLIPMLCHKAGVPAEDTRGRITSHRARSTIASQLYNAKEGMSLAELQAWLGHRTAESTKHYVSVTPTRQAKAYAEAGYLEHNLRMIDVLIDQDVIRRGTAPKGEPWRFYDVGHGHCTYDFFEACPHRMACAKCSFYVPKESSRGQLLEAKANLQSMKRAVPLNEQELAAVEDGLLAIEELSAQLRDVPTPAGPTPLQLDHCLSGHMVAV